MNDSSTDTAHGTAIFANRVKLMGTEAACGFGSRILEVE